MRIWYAPQPVFQSEHMPGLIMNGNRPRQTSISSNSDYRYGAGLHGQVQPSARVLLDGYTHLRESLNGGHQRYGSVRLLNISTCLEIPDSLQIDRGPFPASSLPDMDDPAVMHLLTETAIGDSRQFQVISREESDLIKQELSILSTRIDGTKRKLVLETKLRDAAQSLNRLHESPEAVDASLKSPKRHRRSAMGSRGSVSDMLNKTDNELADSARKCDELAQELWSLEKRAELLRTRLLEHTAGVLQKTHKGFLEKDALPSRKDDSNGYPSGEGFDHSLDLTNEFDDTAFFPTLDAFLDASRAHTSEGSSAVNPDYARHTQAILETERKLEDFNHRLRESIEHMTATSQLRPVPPARGINDEQDPEIIFNDQLNYLEEHLLVIQQSQGASMWETKRAAHITEEKLEHLNSQLREIVNRSFQGQKSEYPVPPEIAGQGPEGQIGYLEAGLDALKQGIQRLIDDHSSLSSQSAGHEGKAAQYDAVLLGLWEILQGGEEELRRQDPMQHEVRREDFSIQAFSTKVQTLFARATGLQEQKEILARQVQQQRELNSTSDPEKDAKLSELSLELEQTKRSLLAKEGEAKESRDDLVLMTERVDAMRQEATLLERRRGTNQDRAEEETSEEIDKELYAELQDKQQQVADLENELAETKDDFGISNAEMLGRLDVSDRRIQSLGNELENSKNEKEKSQKEMRELEGQMVLLQTELTVAKAELDGAYGTRAQRAAEQASNPAKQLEFDELTSRNDSLLGELEGLKTQHQVAERANADLNQRMQTLQRELTETIGEYESMTRASMECEREREQLESNLDALRERCESVESQLSEEKVRWLGMKSPGSTRDSMSQGTTSTQVLKTEFKKMMRDTRAENMRALRVSRGWLIFNF